MIQRLSSPKSHPVPNVGPTQMWGARLCGDHGPLFYRAPFPVSPTVQPRMTQCGRSSLSVLFIYIFMLRAGKNPRLRGTHKGVGAVSAWSGIDTYIDPLIICYVRGPHTHIIRDYKSFNLRVNRLLALSLYVCVAHTHEPNPSWSGSISSLWVVADKKERKEILTRYHWLWF